MITLFKKVPRDKIFETIKNKYPNHEMVRFNGFDGDVTELTQELVTDSLFGTERLVFLSDIDRELWPDIINALKTVSENTIVFWAEDSFPVALTKGMPKHETVDSPAGDKEKISSAASKSNPFQIANQLPFGDGVKTWSVYRSLIDEGQAPEALFGILWWKLKDIAKKKSVITEPFKQTLHKFMQTYSHARETGGDLETGLEKLLLQISKKDL